MDTDRIEMLKALADQPRLPPESAATLADLNWQADDVLRRAKAEPWVTLPPRLRLTRAGVIDFCLELETRAAADALRAHISTPFLDGPQMIFEMN